MGTLHAKPQAAAGQTLSEPNTSNTQPSGFVNASARGITQPSHIDRFVERVVEFRRHCG